MRGCSVSERAAGSCSLPLSHRCDPVDWITPAGTLQVYERWRPVLAGSLKCLETLQSSDIAHGALWHRRCARFFLAGAPGERSSGISPKRTIIERAFFLGGVQERQLSQFTSGPHRPTGSHSWSPNAAQMVHHCSPGVELPNQFVLVSSRGSSSDGKWRTNAQI